MSNVYHIIINYIPTGELGVPPRIPPNAVLHYVVEMQDDEIDDRKASSRFLRQPVDILEDLGFEVCFKAAQELREKGVLNFKKRALEFARDNFKDVSMFQLQYRSLRKLSYRTDVGKQYEFNAAYCKCCFPYGDFQGMRAIDVCVSLTKRSKITDLEVEEGLDMLREVLMINASVVNAKLGNWNEALEDASSITQSNPQHAKVGEN